MADTDARLCVLVPRVQRTNLLSSFECMLAPPPILLPPPPFSNHAIRSIIVGSRSVQTFAGLVGSAGSSNGVGSDARFNSPYSLTLSLDGTTMYVADFTNNLVRKIVVSTATVSTIAGSGAANFLNAVGTNAIFNGPAGVAVNADNSILYVSDSMCVYFTGTCARARCIELPTMPLVSMGRCVAPGILH